MSIYFDTPVQYLKGIGPKLGDILKRKNINNVKDVLEWYPRAYEDRRAARSISSLMPNQMVSIKAEVLKVNSVAMGKSYRKMHEVIISDQTGRIACKFFRTPYRGYFERFKNGNMVRVSGKVILYRNVLQFQHPSIEIINDESEEEDQLIPLYSETEGINSSKIKKIIGMAIDNIIVNPKPSSRLENLHNYKDKSHITAGEFNYKNQLESFPKWILKKYDLINRGKAIQLIHAPDMAESTKYLEFKSEAQKRIIFEEFFWFEVYMALQKNKTKKQYSYKVTGGFESPVVKKILQSLPFELTGAQQNTLKEVFEDLDKGYTMNRMVQGDVGSGKTVVAMICAALVGHKKLQSALMVPTEILAEQHYKNAVSMFEPLGLKVELLLGKTKAKEKKEIIERLKSGEVDLCVGTHALIQKDVEFKNLALTIIDEQHRFGVAQRASLSQKGKSPHKLVMTATPIPRTLAMTVYGDLDVSIINELPKGRIPIITKKVFENKRPKVLGFMADQVKQGRQAYVVYPLVEESEKMDLKNAVDEFEKLTSQYPDIRFGLLHGKMKSEEKDEIMGRFRENEIQVLVSTTVIEVGVDVPNANIIIIEHSERFGLSQLHQLRGRVGRGKHKSYCVLMLGYAVSEESVDRCDVLVESSDGFKIAEKDLEFRGPGEFLGARQSGLPGFKLANLVRDMEVLKQARKAAFELVEKDPGLEKREHKLLKIEYERKKQDIVS